LIRAIHEWIKSDANSGPRDRSQTFNRTGGVGWLKFQFGGRHAFERASQCKLDVLISRKNKQENQKVFGMIQGVDPNFGAKNTKLMADLSARMNEKVGLLDPGGNKADLSQETVRNQFGGVLRTESNIILDLSNQISTALSPTN
jgi:hypothetical protein